MTPLKTLMLRVDLFADTTVGDAAQELCLLAERVGALCVADFNGVRDSAITSFQALTAQQKRDFQFSSINWPA